MSVEITTSSGISVTVSTPSSSAVTVTNKGPKGDIGATGPAGADGAAGATGATGATGADGSTNLSATANGTSLTVESSTGNNVALPAADTNSWGVMTDEMFDAVAANTLKATNVATDLGISGSTGARTITSSDGNNAIIPVATTSVSGVMSPTTFDAVTANTAKNTNVSTNLTATANGTSLTINSSDGNNVALPAATNSAWGIMSDDHVVALEANTAKTTFPGFGTSGSTALVGNTTLLALGTSSSTALAGNTALLALGTSGSTALAGNTTTISGAQASAITANTAKTGITTGQASAITANTAKTSFSNLTGEVTSSGAATTIANNIVDEANLKVSNAPTNGYFLSAQSGDTGGLTWAAAGSGGGDTDLTATTHVSQITINSSTGDNVIIAQASGSIAGVMTVAHHDKLDGIEASATADQTKSDIDGLAVNAGTVTNGVYLNVAQEITSETQINKRKISNVGASSGDCEGDIIYLGTAAASHVAGNIYTLNSSNQWVVTDADATATSIGMLAIAMGTAVSDGMCIRGMANLNTAFAGSPANGAVLYLDNATPGAVTGTAPSGSGDVVRVLGYKMGSGTRMWFNPDNTWLEI